MRRCDWPAWEDVVTGFLLGVLAILVGAIIAIGVVIPLFGGG